jgi:hypothetical protein
MEKIIAAVPVAPMRVEALHQSEMVSQMLLGETAEMLEVLGDFTKVKTDTDNYTGWVQNKQLVSLSDDEAKIKTAGFATENGYIRFNGQSMFISVGTPILDTEKIGKFAVDYRDISHQKSLSFSEEAFKKLAFPLLNTSYLWGGRSAFGVDCSGFAQLMYRFFDRQLPRDAALQAAFGNTIDFLEQARCGDLAYFDNAEGQIVHVGILLNTHTIIHSSGKVRMDKIDAAGIVNVDAGLRTHHLRIIKRIV